MRYADDAVHAQDALTHVSNVHRATVAVVVPGFAKKDLGRHSIEVAALVYQMTVASVVAHDVVIVVQRTNAPAGNGFLTNIEVTSPIHFVVDRWLLLLTDREKHVLDALFPPA